MVKLKRNHYTTSIGTCAERRLELLYNLRQNEDPEGGPDLVNPTEDFVVEVKSGKRQGILYRLQLTHQLVDPRQLEIIFRGERALANQFELFRTPRTQRHYYSVIYRTDETPVKELKEDFSMTKLTHGHNFVFPGELAFFYFVAAEATRKRNSVKKTLDDNKSKLRRYMLGEYNIPEMRRLRKEPGSWHGITHSSAAAIYSGSTDEIRHPVQKVKLERFFDLTTKYTDYENMVQGITWGPEGYPVHFLFSEEDRPHIEQIRRNIRRRKYELEEVIEQRKKMRQRLNGTRLEGREKPMPNGGISEIRQGQLIRKGISKEEIDELERLSLWRTKRRQEYEMRGVPF